MGSTEEAEEKGSGSLILQGCTIMATVQGVQVEGCAAATLMGCRVHVSGRATSRLSHCCDFIVMLLAITNAFHGCFGERAVMNVAVVKDAGLLW